MNSKSALRSSPSTTLSSVFTPLIMSGEISNFPLGSSKNRMGNGVANGSTRSPSVPNHPPPRVFTKQKAVNMNPMPTSKGQNHHRLGHTQSLTDAPRPNGLVEPPHRGASFPGTEPKPHEADYVGAESDSYLTPIDPPYHMTNDSQASSSELPVSPTESEVNSSTWKRGRTRFDSGLGDSESDQGSNWIRFSTSPSMTSSNSVSNPRLSTHHEQHYEDIDQYSRAYQHPQQPSQRGSSDKSQLAGNPLGGIRPLPQVNIGGITHSDSEDSEPVVNISMAETISRSQNDQVQTYDDRGATLPHTYTPLNTKKYSVASVTPTTGGKCGFHVVALIAVYFISLAALIISVYVLFVKTDESSSSQTSPFVQTLNSSEPVPNLNQILSDLQKEITNLKKENTDLKAALSQHENKLASRVEPLQETMSNLISRQENITLGFHSMENKVAAQIANISLTPGPQGVANFSLCKYTSTSGSAPSDRFYKTETVYLPLEEEVESYFVTFAYCTYTGAAGVNLESLPDSTASPQRYRCSCWGQDSNQSRTICTLHLWMCPRNS